MKPNSPTHEEITRRAQEIWQKSGSPGGRDTEIWLEAERELTGASDHSADSESESEKYESPRTTSESKGAVKLADRIKSETAAETTVEHHISPAIPDEEAIKAALQKKEARAPKTPTKIAPKSQPAETGKPLWDRPHSS
jgi:hypothetical protein